MLNIKNITKQFGARRVLDNVSLTVAPNEIAVLLGGSGVGKSTLLRVLCGLEKADNGTITLNHPQENRVLSLAQLLAQRKVGMVFQQFNLFEHLSVLDNVCLAMEKVAGFSRSAATRKARELLRRYHLEDKEHAAIASLSGGQKQRLALVRALALEPEIICLDEPSSALDPLLTLQVAQEIYSLVAPSPETSSTPANYSILIATHDMDFVKQLGAHLPHALTIYLMEDGKIVETARFHNLQAHAELYRKIHSFMLGQHVSS
jgi:polar amino acid transport system ATP-binding protein